MVYYINGFLPNQAKKVCMFFFADFFVSIKMDPKERCFNIKLKRSLFIKDKNGVEGEVKIEEVLDIKDFKEFWGPQWKLLYEINEPV